MKLFLSKLCVTWREERLARSRGRVVSAKQADAALLTPTHRRFRYHFSKSTKLLGHQEIYTQVYKFYMQGAQRGQWRGDGPQEGSHPGRAPC